MNTDLNTLLTTLYVHLDDRIFPAIGFTRDHHPGRKPALNDVELLCLLVAQHLLGISSDRKRIRHARKHLKGMFPHLPGQSGWGNRVRQSTGLLSAVITELARDTPSWNEVTRLIDSTPLPCGKSRETVKRSDLAGHAGYGYCASHSRFFWGFRLYPSARPTGCPWSGDSRTRRSANAKPHRQCSTTMAVEVAERVRSNHTRRRARATHVRYPGPNHC